MTMNKLRNSAEKLREQGYSYNLINQKLGISKSTMSYWFKDKPYTPNEVVLRRIKNTGAINGIRNHNKRVQEIEMLKEQGIKELGILSERDLWLVGIGLYIGEGAKTTESIRVSNSDPAVIRLAVKWLKEVFKLSNENFVVRLHIYPDTNFKESRIYWQKVTGLSKKNFYRPSIDKRIDKQKSRSGKIPYGTAHVTVVSNGDKEKGVRAFRKMNGWITGVMSQIVIN